jgi:thioredoxin reductase/ferredoxin
MDLAATVPLAMAACALLLLALGAIADDRRNRMRRRAAAVVRAGLAEPPLVHSINDDRCIGCEACVDVCPTQVLELVHHKARVVRFSDCVQCEQCANSCPTTALVMHREGAAPQTLTVPELDDHFQTGVPGQYLIGEVAGKPLVKNAANLGRAVIEHITRALPPHAPHGVLDVVIVGSGPGGLSAGLTCIKNRLTCVVLEKEHVLASTVSRYPKGKLFMAEPSTVANVSYLPAFDASKEELVAAWRQVVEGAQLPVKLGEAVEKVVRGDDGVFTVKTTVSTYRARTVVLATGLRGKPRLLAVPGANLEKVRSRLDDPDELRGQEVLVVGGGDSAVEAAISLTDAGARVTLSYRGDGFKRCKAANQKRLAELERAGALPVLLESNVAEFTAEAVAIKLADGTTTTIANHAAFVLIGADTPVAWLEANQVRFIEREHLYALGSTEDAVRAVVSGVDECPRAPEEALARITRKSHGRLRSIVDDMVTGVTGVFKLPKEPTQSRLRTFVNELSGVFRRPVPPPPPSPRPAVKRTASPVIPVRRLTAAKSNPFTTDKTVEMHRYSGPTSLARGTPESNRPAPVPRPPVPSPAVRTPFADDHDTEIGVRATSAELPRHRPPTPAQHPTTPAPRAATASAPPGRPGSIRSVAATTRPRPPTPPPPVPPPRRASTLPATGGRAPTLPPRATAPSGALQPRAKTERGIPRPVLFPPEREPVAFDDDRTQVTLRPPRFPRGTSGPRGEGGGGE